MALPSSPPSAQVVPSAASSDRNTGLPKGGIAFAYLFIHKVIIPASCRYELQHKQNNTKYNIFAFLLTI